LCCFVVNCVFLVVNCVILGIVCCKCVLCYCHRVSTQLQLQVYQISNIKSKSLLLITWNIM